MARGRCDACRHYLARNGYDRSWAMVERQHARESLAVDDPPDLPTGPPQAPTLSDGEAAAAEATNAGRALIRQLMQTPLDLPSLAELLQRPPWMARARSFCERCPVRPECF
ncbi:MAG: hypothetical protein ACRDYZ_15205, partial [Acidimicrobiales bacterium]